MQYQLTANLLLNKEQFSANIKQVRRELLDTVKATAELSGKLDQAQQSMTSYGGALEVGAGTAAIAGGLAMTAKAAISAAGEVERYRGILVTLNQGNKEIADQQLAWVKNFANVTPYATQEVVASFVKLQSHGIDAQKTLGTLGDTAAATGKDIMQAVEAFADASQGEFERLKEFGVKARTNGNNITFAFQDSSGKMRKVTSENNAAMIQQTLQGIWNDKYKGAMNTLSTSWVGLWSTLQGEWWNFTAAIGESGLLDAAKEQLTKFIELLQSQAGKELAKNLGLALRDMVMMAGKLVPIFSQVVSILAPSAGALAKVGVAMAGVGGAFLAYTQVAPRVLELIKTGTQLKQAFAAQALKTQVSLSKFAAQAQTTGASVGGMSGRITSARGAVAGLGAQSAASGALIQAGLAAAIAFTSAQLIKLAGAVKDWMDTNKEVESNLKSSTALAQSQAVYRGFADALNEVTNQGKVTSNTLYDLDKLRDAGVIGTYEYQAAARGEINILTRLRDKYKEQVEVNHEVSKAVKEKEEADKAAAAAAKDAAERSAESLKQELKLRGDLLEDIAKLKRDNELDELKNTEKYYDAKKRMLEEDYEAEKKDAESRGAATANILELLGKKYDELYNKLEAERVEFIDEKAIEELENRFERGSASLDEYVATLDEKLATAQLKYGMDSDEAEKWADKIEAANKRVVKSNDDTATTYEALKNSFRATAESWLDISDELGANIGKGAEGLRNSLKSMLLMMVKAVREKLVIAKISALAEGVASGGIAGLGAALSSLAPLMGLNALLATAEQGIVSLASGAIAYKPTVAIVGDNPHSPEVISPLSDLRAIVYDVVSSAMRMGGSMAGGSGVSAQTIVVPVSIDGREIARVVAEQGALTRR